MQRFQQNAYKPKTSIIHATNYQSAQYGLKISVSFSKLNDNLNIQTHIGKVIGQVARYSNKKVLLNCQNFNFKRSFFKTFQKCL